MDSTLVYETRNISSNLVMSSKMVICPTGKVGVCKIPYIGSNPIMTSKYVISNNKKTKKS